MEHYEKHGKDHTKNIYDYIQEHYPHDIGNILLADGFEEAFMGVVESMGTPPKACYDRTQCLTILMKRDGMSSEEAEEYFNFNVAQAYVGENTPAFVVRAEDTLDQLPLWQELSKKKQQDGE